MSIHLYDNDYIRWEHDGHLYLLHVHSDPYPDNPRMTDENLCVMACWHQRYTLGDAHDRGDTPEAFWRSLVRQYVPRNAVLEEALHGGLGGIRIEPCSEGCDVYERCDLDCPFDTDDNEEVLAYQGVSSDHVPEYILDDLTVGHCMQLLQPYAAWLPLWLYDHGGITISCGAVTYPFTDRWDAGQLGWIVCSKTNVMSVCCCPETMWRSKAVEVMQEETNLYDQYLRGEVYYYNLLEAELGDEPEWGEADNCGGFYGSDIETSGMVDAVGCGLADAVADGGYTMGTAKEVTTVTYKYA